jgi:O-antigen/teichoic acid export membrane protein
MQFKEIVLPRFFIGTINQISMLIMAYLGYGLYSLVIPPVFASIISCMYYYYISSFRPRFDFFGIKYWRKIFSYTKYLIVNIFFSKLTNEADTLLIGKRLDLKNLGMYDLSYNFSNLFYINTMPILNNITFPVFSKNQNDLNKVRDQFLKLLSISSFFYIPITIFLILSAHITVEILYGPKWIDIIIPYQILSVYIIFRSISAPASSLYNALGKPEINTYYNLVFTPILIVGIYFFTTYGLITTCIFIMITRSLGSLYHIYKCKQLISYSYNSFLERINTSVVASLLSYIISFGIINYTGNQFFCLVFPILYLAVCLIFYKKSFLKNVNLILSFIKLKIK